MSGCHVILASDKPCGNYARYKMTCCWVHRSLEYAPIEPYTDSDVVKKGKVAADANRCEFIKTCGERCKKSHGYNNKFCSFHKGLENISKANEERNKSKKTFSESDSDSDDPKDKSYRANIRKPVVAKKVESLNPNGEPRCQYIIPRRGSQCLKDANCEAGFCYIHMPLGTIKDMKV
jgi:hypothetical protein